MPFLWFPLQHVLTSFSLCCSPLTLSVTGVFAPLLQYLAQDWLFRHVIHIPRNTIYTTLLLIQCEDKFQLSSIANGWMNNDLKPHFDKRMQHLASTFSTAHSMLNLYWNNHKLLIITVDITNAIQCVITHLQCVHTEILRVTSNKKLHRLVYQSSSTVCTENMRCLMSLQNILHLSWGDRVQWVGCLWNPPKDKGQEHPDQMP